MPRPPALVGVRRCAHRPRDACVQAVKKRAVRARVVGGGLGLEPVGVHEPIEDGVHGKDGGQVGAEAESLDELDEDGPSLGLELGCRVREAVVELHRGLCRRQQLEADRHWRRGPVKGAARGAAPEAEGLEGDGGCHRGEPRRRGRRSKGARRGLASSACEAGGAWKVSSAAAADGGRAPAGAAGGAGEAVVWGVAPAGILPARGRLVRGTRGAMSGARRGAQQRPP